MQDFAAIDLSGSQKPNRWTNNCFRGEDRSRHARNLSNVKQMSSEHGSQDESKDDEGKRFCTDLL